MKYTCSYIFLVYVLSSFCNCDPFFQNIKVLDLKKWSVESKGILNKTTIEIPNGIFTIAEKHNLIEDILKNNNANTSKWIANQPWTFTYNFIGEDISKSNNIELIFDGIDSVAEIKLNDVVLGVAENMFMQYVFNIKTLIKTGDNKLEVIFQPPLEAAAKAFSAKKHEVPPKCPPSTYKGDCHINMLRKVQASFGSIFGPSIPSIGFWKSARIEGYRESTLREVITRIEERNETFWRLNVDAYLAKNTEQRIYGRISLHVDAIPYGVTILDVVPNAHGEMVWSGFIDFNKSSVENWWPNGYGPQRLYNLTVYYYSSDLVERIGKVKMIGFRKIDLVQQPTGKGNNFYFSVNKVPIFAKGSNLIPLNILPENIDNEKRIRRVIDDAVNSNMNMIRVWGGGAYLSEHFYHLADRKGILIWQDFMFTNSLYPSDDDFLSNSLAEVRYQLKKVYAHPSLAVFSANFETEMALGENWFNVGNKTLYVEDYRKLFIETIKNEFDRLTQNSGNFISSSPSNGNNSDVAKEPNSELFGDYHNLGKTNLFDTSKYPIPRFASVYGLQSLPCMESILKQANSTSDLNPKSAFLLNRQHEYADYQTMENQILLELNLPAATNVNYDKRFIIFSQIIQSLYLKLQTEHYRAHRSFLTSDGRGNTMGALYWQMNDLWIAPTQSGIDYYGKWKMAQYYIKDAFAPIIITGAISNNTLKVYVVSDESQTRFNAVAKIKIYSWASLKPLKESLVNITVIGHKSQLISTIDVNANLKTVNCTVERCFFYLTLEQQGDLLAPENYVLPTNLKKTTIARHSMKITSIAQLRYQNIYELTITTDSVAAFVWLDAHGLEGKFSENGFLMVEPEKTVYFYPDGKYQLSSLKATIDVTHAYDSKY